MSASDAPSLSAINHIVVVMLENRSFDHMLGFLYSDAGNVSPAGQPFEGLTGKESNPGAGGTAAVTVFKIQPAAASTYFMPGADPGEGYTATNSQLFGSNTAPTPPVATNQGFISDFSYTLGWEAKENYSIFAGTVANDIMGMHTPETLPVLSALARGFAVCDHWYGSVPTETLPNRAFVHAGTSQGHMDDKTKTFTAPSIYTALTKQNVSWKVYGYTAEPLTRMTFTDLTNLADTYFGQFTDFQSDAANGSLPSYSFLEPSWGSKGNSQHPNYDVALGEQFLHDVYYALRNSPAWSQTLLIVTYDEHGGCYDHVAPPAGAVAPDASVGEYGFDFTRFGPRVPTVLISPLIPAGTVFRVAQGATPFDHTSILKTVEQRWNVPPLTKRDAAAPDVGAVLTLTTPRTDDPLAGVTVPVSSGTNPSANKPSHLQEVYAELVSRLPVPDAEQGTHRPAPRLETGYDYDRYINERVMAWKASRKSTGS
ncbi:alkaline phosphatase family protein [Dyella acidiphila]|uniref:Phosphoesterase n=1 Tax=Dyella acidiphila TaxID=2775866 RepID=A0ABR9G709_9GAMM|nr:alkaline phosphatase family protein [Dyella acidiphila]MBE1159836.1 phosphoesterase [Dyella acidiphila]